jgi:ParB family chromosome partitioning protein
VKTRRGGLGKGLGSLIPTAPPAPTTQRETMTAPETTERDTTGEPQDHARSLGRPTSAGPEVPQSPETAGSESEGRDGASSQDASSTGAADGAGPGIQPAQSVAAELVEGDSGPSAEVAVSVSGAYFAEVPIAAIRPNPKQPRQVFDEDALAELTASIREFGVLQPIVVRPLGSTEGPDAGGSDDSPAAVRYELVMGERRLRAAGEAGLSAISAIVRETADADMLRDALLENIHRAQLNPLEEAAAYQQLLEEFGTTHEELATRIGRSRSQVSNTIRLLNLPVAVQRRVAAGVLSAGHARALLSLADADQQDALAARIVAEGLSVRATEELVALAAKEGIKPARRPSPRITAPAIAQLSDKLSDAFDTRVRVELGKRKGKITVEFGSIDDLERLVALMAPQLAT